MHVKARGQSWNVLNKEPRCTHEDGNKSSIIWSKHPQFSPFADWKLVFVRSFRVFLVWIRYRLLLYFTEAAELGNLRQRTLRKRQGFRSIVEQDIELLLKWKMNQILQPCVLQRPWRDIAAKDFNYIFSEDVELNRIN